MPNRLSSLRNDLPEYHFDAYVCTKQTNIRYYTGSYGGSFLISSPEIDSVLLASPLDSYISKDQATDCLIEVCSSEDMIGKLVRYLRKIKAENVGFDDLTHNSLSTLKKRAPEITLSNNTEPVWRQRKVKSNEEIKRISEACFLADSAMEALKEKAKTGVSEHELAATASYTMMVKGSESHAFDLIVASGPHSAYPHSPLTDRKLRRGDFVVVDIGANFIGYRSDITRTFIVGKPNQKASSLYETVLRANEVAFTRYLPEADCKEVDASARKIIEDAGYGPQFIHSLGHGIGLDVHEPPSLSQKSLESLQIGNIVSNEPGIYVHGWGGVRIEDTVLVDASGSKRLTNFTRDLDQMII